MDVIERARTFAADKHKTQRRKSANEPYFNHLESVVNLLRRAGIEEPVIIAAAYLHDTVEDTDTTMQEVIHEFGHDIAELVYWLTDNEEGNRQARNLMSSWRLARAPMPAKLVKFADIIDNAAGMRDDDWHFYRAWAVEKRAILTRMLEFEGGTLSTQPLFQRAWSAVNL